MARRSISLLFALLLVVAAAAAAVAVEGDSEAPEDLEGVVEASDEGLPPVLAEDFDLEDLPPGIAAKWSGDQGDVEDLPYGLAKKLDPCLLPPGQAKKAVEGDSEEACGEEPAALDEEIDDELDEGLPPFLAEGFEVENLPPGIAAKWGGDPENLEGLPYGLAKKLDPDAPHPGKGKNK